MRISDWSSDVCSSDLDPVLKWDVIDVGSGEQIEFWPIPVINGSATAERVRFTGIKALPSLTSDSDIAVLDDIMITQFVAAEILAHDRSEEHTSELQSLMRISYAVFCLKKKNPQTTQHRTTKRTQNHN